MNLWQSLVLGLVQGIAEFLPISSSGHLIVLQDWMNLPDVPILYDIMLHVATLVVVIIFFRRRIGAILAAIGRWIARRPKEGDAASLRLVLVLLLATVLTVIIGFGVERLGVERFPAVVCLLFVVTGGILIASRFAKGSDDYAKLSWKHGLIAGIAQGIGVFPGISRSGITISGALFSGMEREKAGEFSFLLSIPAILGALILELKDAQNLLGGMTWSTLAAGMIMAAVAGTISLWFLMKLIRKGRLWLFAFYLIPFGIGAFLYTILR